VDPDIVHDPVFQELLKKHEVAARKLRDAVIAMRAFYLTHHKRPEDETTTEKWRGAVLGEDAARTHEAAVDAAANLLRYGFELAPHSNCPVHLEELYKLKADHRERLERRTGWGKGDPHPKGIEEQVHVDGGPPITLVFKPSAWEFTERGKRAAARRQPAILPEDTPSSEPPPE